MTAKTLFITAAVVSIFFTGAAIGFAYADGSDQGYSQHWFSSTGYGPNDEHGGGGGIQGPSDADRPDADDESSDQNDNARALTDDGRR